MSQKNDNSEAAGVIGLVGAGMIIMAAVLFAVVAFFAIVLTVIAFFAWDKPRRIGKFTIQPHEARAFVYRGIIGAIAVPACTIFACILFDQNLNLEQWFFYLALGGYSFGSVVIGMAEAQGQSEEEQESFTPPAPAQKGRALVTQDRQATRKEEFTFATWDDEDARG